MLERLRTRLRHFRRHSESPRSGRPRSVARTDDEKQRIARQAQEIADAWNALDTDTRNDMLAAAEELKQVHDEYRITDSFMCSRTASPESSGPLRSAEDMRAESRLLRRVLGNEKDASAPTDAH
ncbi:hypothetical protein IM25_24970 (plasmid) [Rhodococcus sp. p52]|uniref:hypothetical protein n=1 Tax=Rhodococcus TaxID=1827 RepID=UPI0002D8C3C5|nr:MULTISPECIES: hypothetical protein [Rhodococcus]AOD24984.1 hypothetical protein IM25_24970 [Rhodococcus sp. p52]MBX4171861.1 hypothetical protein [Rhodococcus sp. DMU2021]UPK66524.1 hypothetical protein MYP14_25195 [Rhodococcus pyridinivorans]UTT51240.1 hypothetical protein NMQ04_23260 [Rhodococcus gordoniae]BDB63468.1 hypothetical protein RDE2_52620 [Rhodococcus sp. RDE2]